LNACIGVVSKSHILFVSVEDRKHMIKQLRWFAKHGDASYVVGMINYENDWWLDPDM
jgi:hypothetical protein